VADVIAAARPLAAMLWARETEGHQFDTPERRAALEARINQITASIGDDSVRKYYRQDFASRIAQAFAPAQIPRGAYQPRGRGQQEGWRDRAGGNRPRNGFAPRPEPGSRNTPYVVVSQQLAGSALHRGARTMVPRREALILQAALNHPWLLHDHLEELSQLEFRHPDGEKLKGALIDVAAHAAALDPEALRKELAARGLAEVMARVAAAITTPSVWGARADAAAEDVLVTWQQLVALQRKRNSLVREVMEAEQAFNQDYTDRNYLRLKDANERLSSLDGTEALIEGFGASSGRGVRSL
jgi:DNA primase